MEPLPTKTHPIEVESFGIIQSELGDHRFTETELAVVMRVIHATADLEFRDTFRIHPAAIGAGITALRRGAPVVTDVRMVEAGIDAGLVERLGGRVVCDIQHPVAIKMARDLGFTRAAAAMHNSVRLLQDGIAVIGNAPTALLEVIRLIRDEGVRPALIVGVPVGFVSAAESKELLTHTDVPYITALGRKGGSPVAVAIVNALLRLATNLVTEAG